MGCMRGRRLISDESSETSRRGLGRGLSRWAGPEPREQWSRRWEGRPRQALPRTVSGPPVNWA